MHLLTGKRYLSYGKSKHIERSIRYKMDDDFINNVIQMAYEDYETNKIMVDYLGEKPEYMGGGVASSIHTKSQLLGTINLLLRNRSNGLLSQ